MDLVTTRTQTRRGRERLLAGCPNATLLAHPRTARHLVDPTKLVAGALEVYGEARFAELYGRIDPAPEARVRGLEDGETFELGGATLRVHHTYGHAFHHFVVDDPAVSTVYTGDAFGLVYPALQRGRRFAIPSTSPTGFDAPEAHKSIDKILALGERYACLTHFGAIDDLDVVAAQLRAWIDRSEAWVVDAAARDETVAETASRLEREIGDAMAKAANEVGLFLGRADSKLLALDVELNALGLAVVAEKRRRGG